MTIVRWFVSGLAQICLGATLASGQPAFLRDVPGESPLPALSSGATRARLIDPDLSLLRAARPATNQAAVRTPDAAFALDLFPDARVSVVLESREELDAGSATLVGSVVGEPAGRAYFAIDEDVLAADILLPRARYEIRYLGDGRHIVLEVDASPQFKCGTPIDGVSARHRQYAAAAVRADQPVFEGPPVIVDLLVAYTPRAATNAGGPAGIRSLIVLAVTVANDSLARSLVPHRIRLVHTAPTPYVESGLLAGAGGDYTRLASFNDGFMDELPVLRDSVQADLVAVVVDDATDWGGIAELMRSFDLQPVIPSTGYSVNVRAGLSYVLPHELGHNLSLHHDRETSPGAVGLFPYGFGYRRPGLFSTIMAYPCTGQPCPRIFNYSNPSVLHNGVPTGVADSTEEARALVQTMPVAASYRGCRTRLTPSVSRLILGPQATTISFAIASDSECTWHLTEPAQNWITRMGPAEGRTSATLTYAIEANPSPVGRAHRLEVSGLIVDIEQRACLEIVTPLPMRFRETGGPGALVIDAIPGCSWSIDPISAGSIVSPTSALTGSGSGQFTFTVTPSPASFPFVTAFLTLRSGPGFARTIEILRDGTFCSGAIEVDPGTIEATGAGGAHAVGVTASPSCTWSLATLPSWITASGARTGTGNGAVPLTVAPNASDVPRAAILSVSGRVVRVAQRGCEPTLQLPGPVGAMGGRVEIPATAPSTCLWSALPTGSWFRVEVGAAMGHGTVRLFASPNLDPLPRQLEFTVNARPYVLTQLGAATSTRYLSEGATGTFFSTRLAVLNPGTQPVEAQFRFLRADGSVRTRTLLVPARRRMTVTTESVPGLAATDFSTVLESSGTLLLDRTMTWDRSGFGSHAETSLAEPSTTWYLAEGATTGDFSLFYLLQNPNAVDVDATVTFLLPGGAPPIVRSYALGPSSRRTIPVDTLGPPLDSTDVSAVVTATQPIIVERAMYATRAGQPFAAGHNSAGVTQPALQWFLAEGATGTFFDLFVLIANPNASPAQLAAEYLLPDGTVLTKDYAVPANSRHTIWVDDEQIPAGSGVRPLASVSVSTTIRSTNGVPVIVERAMWWPGPETTADYWTEAHNSPGSTVTGTRWGLAEGEVGGPNDSETFILIANTSAVAGSARVQLFFEDGTTAERTVTLAPKSRTNVAGSSFAEAAQKRFGAIVESLGTTPAQIVVERAMYSNAGGVFWAAGTNALATRLAP